MKTPLVSSSHDDEEYDEGCSDSAPSLGLPPPAPPDLLCPHSPNTPNSTLRQDEYQMVIGCDETTATLPSASILSPVPTPDLPGPGTSEARPQHSHTTPNYLQDYILD